MFYNSCPIIQNWAALCILAVPLVARAAAPEVRGTWVTTTGLANATSTVRTPAATNANFARLRNVGLNTVYMDVWRNGYTYYPSPTLAAITGIDRAPEIGSRNLLQETLTQSHRNGMLQIGWYQYGFAAKFGTPGTSSSELAGYMKSHGWLLQDSSGAYTNSSNSFSWMNPVVPEVRTFLKNIIVDAVKNHDLDGIQFDDRLAWPVQFGYDAATRNAYLSETGRNLPANYADAQFKAWRAQKVTSFAQELIADLKAIRPNLIVSIAPSVYPFSYDNYCVDWPTWKSMGLFDEFVPQVYRNTYSDFNNSWDGTGSVTTGGQVQFMTGRRWDFRAGISINTSSGAPNPWIDVQQSIDLVRATSGVGGHVLWYSDGVLNAYEAQATAYYNVAGTGQAPRPDVPADWRPSPVAASASGGGSWSASIAAKDRYQLIWRSGDNWTVSLSTVLGPGTFVATLPSAEQVELLVDRRGYIDGDANLDGVVDITDLSRLATHWQTAGVWSDGDFDVNGFIDISDLAMLATHWQDNTSLSDALAMLRLPAVSVPEPALACLSFLVLICRRIHADTRAAHAPSRH